MLNHGLTTPQIRLLLKLHEKPAMIHNDYRPLRVLIEKDLVRLRHQGTWGDSQAYEMSPAGAALVTQIKEHNAENGLECRCSRPWSLKHEPHCPVSGSLTT